MTQGIKLRSIIPEDCDAIARIAKATAGFTVPSRYLVWMLATTQGELCRVAVDEHDTVIGYTLATRTAQVEVCFSWQTAVLPDFRSQHVAAMLVGDAARAARNSGISIVRFTCPAAQAATMTNLVSVGFQGKIIDQTPIAAEWGIDEIEFRFRFN